MISLKGNNKMKQFFTTKFLVLAVFAVALAFSLTACGGNKTANGKTKKVAPSSGDVGTVQSSK